MTVESSLNVDCGNYSITVTKFITPFYRRFPSHLIARIMTQKMALAKAILNGRSARPMPKGVRSFYVILCKEKSEETAQNLRYSDVIFTPSEIIISPN